MRRRRRSEPTAIGKLLPKWLSRRGMNAELLQYEIWVRWPELVGSRLAAHTEPGALKNGQLTVRVGSAAWLHELSFLRADLVRQINAALGDERVREVRLLASGGPTRRAPGNAGMSIKQPTKTDSAVPPVELDPALSEVDAAATSIKDEELRQTVRRANLARLKATR